MTRAEGDLQAEIEVCATRVRVMWRDEELGRVDPRSAAGPTILIWEFSAIDVMFFLLAGLPG